MREELLKDSYSRERAKVLQEKYQKVVEKETIKKNRLNKRETISHLAGVDVSYFSQNKKELGIACAIIWNLIENKIVETSYAKNEIKFPYIPGFLGFRECKVLSNALLKLSENVDVVLCDGHGIIHPKRFGEAVQLGIALDIPTIGVAKNPFIGYCNWKSLKRKKGNKTPVWNYNPSKIKSSELELLGYAVCLRDHSKPVFISEGYRVDIKLAIEVVLDATKTHRLPEPLFLADKYSRKRIPIE
jgi:deoxyribonuclease V